MSKGQKYEFASTIHLSPKLVWIPTLFGFQLLIHMPIKLLPNFINITYITSKDKTKQYDRKLQLYPRQV